ncbi:MAG: PadR family transcriptional regulator [Oscillospiraceae bacterium]
MKIDKTLMSGSTTLLVLSLLTDGEKYGYEMTSELERRSDGTFSLKEGTLYPLLHALEKDGCVKSRMKEAPNGRERKYYRLTKKGAALLDEKTEEWKLFSEKVNAVIGFSPAVT